MRFRIAIATLAVGVVALAGSMGSGGRYIASAHAASPAPPQRTGDVIVKFKRSATLGAIAGAIGGANASATASTAGSGLVLLKPDAGQSVDHAVTALQASADVEFAEADIRVSIAQTPTDPLYVSYQWSLPQIFAPGAWDATTGSASTIIAVIDTGVDATHPDLAGKITTGANAGFNFVGNNTNTADDESHGTFVAGIIAANANNGQGGAGVCWLCKIMPVKVLDSTGSGSTFNVSQGIDWAVAHGAKVLNLSLGAPTGTASLQTSVDNAWNAGVIVVAASGNNAADADPTNDGVLFPAAYPHALAIGSVTQAGARSTFSDFGPELDLMAPGENVLGTLCTCAGNPGGYATGSGTSFASPHVAGVVGLMISNGITDRDTIFSRLTSSAVDMGAAGFDNLTGWGEVQAQKSVLPQYQVSWSANTLPTSIVAATATSANVTFTNAGWQTWSASGANPVHFSYHWRNGACAGTTSAIYDGVRTSLSADVATSGSVTNLSAQIQAPPAAGTYCLVYDLVREGMTWLSNQGAATQTGTVSVTAPVYGVTWGANTLPSTIAAGGSTNVNATFTNTGSLTWLASGTFATRFAYHWSNGACPGTTSAIYDGVRTAIPSNIATGATVTNLSVQIAAPPAAGTYCLIYDLVRESVAWFSTQGAATQSATVTVTAGQYAVTWGANTLPSSVAAGSTTPVTATFTNAGTLTWPSSGANQVRFGYRWYSGACPAAGATAYNTPRAALPGNIAQGGTVTNLSHNIIAPASAGTYCLVYDLVREGVTWFAWQGAATQSATVTVTAPPYGVTWGATNTTSTMTASSSNAFNVTLTNSGSLTWAAGGGNPVRFSYHWLNGACPGTTTAAFDGLRSVLPGDIPANFTVTNLNVSVTAPASAGTYCLQYDLVREGVTWFSWQGANMLSTTVTVS